MGRANNILKILLAVLLGEVSLILLTTVAQEVMFDGIDYYNSPLSDIFFGGIATFIAAVLAGMVASLIVRGTTLIPHIIISCLIMVEMSYLLASGTLNGPFWFDILSGFSLIVGVWAGHYATQTFIYRA